MLPVAANPVTAVANVEVDLTTANGENRYDTAALIALEAFEGPLANIIIARGDAFPDALAGNALAGAAEAPILLTRPSSLPEETRDAILALADEDTVFHFLGGEEAIADSVIAEVEALFAPEEDEEIGTEEFVFWRIAGEDRYDTAINIAEFMDENLTIGTTFVGEKTAFITRGNEFADAVSVGPLAYDGKSPVLLVPQLAEDSTQLEAELDLRVRDVLDTIEDLDIDSVIILGQTVAVTTSIEDALKQRLGPEKVLRVGGENRWATSAMIADLARDQYAFDIQTVLIARGENNPQAFADALAGGPWGGMMGWPILLTRPDSLPTETAKWLDDNDNVIRKLIRLGGPAAVSDTVMFAARDAAQTGAIYNLTNRTDAPELQFVRLVEGQPDLLEYVFDEPVSGSSLFQDIGPDGEFLSLRAYSNSCAGGFLLWVNGAGTVVASNTDPSTPADPFEPLLDENGIQQQQAGDSQVDYAIDASILGNGNVVRARFPIGNVELYSRATVYTGAIADETGLRGIEAGYPIRPTLCSLAIPGTTGLPRLTAVDNWALAPELTNIQRVTVDFLFENQDPSNPDNYPEWLLGPNITTTLPGNPANQSFAGSEPHASQFYLVANNSSVYQGATISVAGTGPVGDAYRVRVFFNFEQSVVNAGALRRGYVRDTDGQGALAPEATDLVQSARYVESSGITNDPDLVAVTSAGPFPGGFETYNFIFDEAISNLDAELNEDYFFVYTYDPLTDEYMVSESADFVTWEAGAASRVARAYFAPGDIPVGSVVGGFVEDAVGDDITGPGATPACGPFPCDFGPAAVRGTDTPQNLNQGWNRAAEASLSLMFVPDAEEISVIPAGYTAVPDLIRVTKTQDAVTQNWRVSYTFDRFGGNICTVDDDVFFSLWDPQGIATFELIDPSALPTSFDPNVRVWCVAGTNTVIFDGGPNGVHLLLNDPIENAVVGGVVPDDIQFAPMAMSWVTEGSAIITPPNQFNIRFPDGAEVVPAGVS